MGGGTTNVTNTGLGDDQFQTLANNQSGISDQIGSAATDAESRYKGFDTRFNSLDSGVSGLSSSMLNQFSSTKDAMAGYNTAMGGRFDSLDKMATQNNNAFEASTAAKLSPASLKLISRKA